MVLMEDTADRCVRGIGGDGENSAAVGVDEESGLGGGEGNGYKNYPYRVIFVRPAWTSEAGTA